ncbi:MAG: circadian clock protein KaiC, partial [Thermoplasmata archaeon]
MRSTHHGEGVYPYMFVRGMGVVVRASAAEVTHERGGDFNKIFDKALSTAESKQAPKYLISKIEKMRDNWDYDYSPEEALQIVFESYGIK